MVLIGSGCLHRPQVTDKTPYERIILYISPDFLRRMSSPGCDLESCFHQARADSSYVLRPAGQFSRLMDILTRLEAATNTEAFGQALLCRSLFLEFLIWLTRELTDHQLRYVSSDHRDEKILAVLRYLNLHPTEPVSIDHLAEQFFISKYYLMRRFKKETGYTIHGYLMEKRLFLAQERIAAGMSPTHAGESCGFGDYSSFSRAFKKRFGLTPAAGLPPAHVLPGE